MRTLSILFFALLSFQANASKVHQHEKDAGSAYNEIKSLLNKAKAILNGRRILFRENLATAKETKAPLLLPAEIAILEVSMRMKNFMAKVNIVGKMVNAT